jgi:hypothetical protein
MHNTFSSSGPHDVLKTGPSTLETAGANARHVGLARRRFLAIGAASAFGSMFANAGGAFAAVTTKKKVVPKTSVKPAAKPTATKVAAAPTVAPATADSKPASAGGSFSEAQELAINFSFVNSGGGGRFHNPYVVVWIEDANEALVRNVSLNYQIGRGDRWLSHLQRWTNAYSRNEAALGANRVQEVSGPTRIPGAYSLAWDGRDEAKNLVPHGTYYVCIEAAVEKGSYQLVREAIQLTGAPVTKSPADNGDLQRAKFELRARK